MTCYVMGKQGQCCHDDDFRNRLYSVVPQI